ncbi:MAG: glycosyltransferase family 39 protein [Dehalococcoidia bacterium]|nr:glycosyltransferase family 39 protein [Dehalococcoidia bacterium]
MDLAVVVSLTALAAALRLWHLGTVPLGLHGDEAWTGIDARRVLRDGWIAPYVQSALGQPTGPLYLTAALFKLLPQTTYTLRFSMALFGIATIPLAYAAFRTMFTASVGAFAALLLAVMTWHLQLTRTGFMIGAWPFIEMAVAWALFAGIRRRSVALLTVAGALTGAGIYTYNAYLLFVPAVAVAVVWAIAAAGTRRDGRRLATGGVTLAVAGLVVATPMIVYIAGHLQTYRSHQQTLSVTQSQPWQDAGIGGKADILRHRFDEWARGLAAGGRPDLGDGLASAGQPVVDPVTLALALIGLGVAVWRWRQSAYAFVLAVVVVAPAGALATLGDGLFRRTFGMAPFVALLAALPLAWLWERAAPRRDLRGGVAIALAGMLVAYPAVANVYGYFGPAQDSATMRLVYPYEDDAASRYIASLPAGAMVYFYSDRWSFDYETRRFLAPRATGIDRSREFGGVAKGEALDFSRDPQRPVAFVFLDAYLGDADTVTAQYPGGKLTEGRRGGELTFRGYLIPAAGR